MAKKFKKGQKVICVHYKNKCVLTVDQVITQGIGSGITEVWVNDSNKKHPYWWGPVSWFKKVGK